MKVLQLIGSLVTGGAEKLVVDTVPLMVDQGINVDVLLINGYRTDFYDLLEEQGCSKIFSLGNSYYNPLNIFKIIPFFKKYDVVHVHLFPAQYLAALAKILSMSNVQLVFTEHNTSNKRLEKRWLLGVEKQIYQQYANVICITDQVKNVLRDKIKLPNERMVTIENGVDLRKIAAAPVYQRQKLGFTDRDILLIMVAAFRVQKDQDTLIRALRGLPEQYKLLLVGDGERRQKLEGLTMSLDLSDRVTFLGNRQDVYSLLKMADIAVLSSHWEGFGLAAVEAMACGTPLIGSNVQGLAQVIKDGGLLFEKQDVAQLTQQILSLDNDSSVGDLINKGLERSKDYDILTMVERVCKIYNRLAT